MMLLADLWTGQTAGAEVLFLIAVVLFAIVAVLHVIAKQVPTALLAIGLAAVALAWVLL